MKKGFTLIELLIVIAVIAILVGMALPRFRGMQAEGNTAKAAGEIRSLVAAVESYYIHNGKRYPSQSTSVQTSWQSNIVSASPKIVGSVLVDPFDTANQYRYATSAASNSNYYVIFSVGSDGTAQVSGVNTSGDVTFASTPSDDIYISNGTSGVGGF